MIYIIIPTYNEEKALPVTLSALFEQPDDVIDFQVIVADGESTDRTEHIAREAPNVSLLTARKGRASQMNAGAAFALAHGAQAQDWLLFLHADTILPPTAIQQLTTLRENPSIQAGGFLHQFSGTDWRLRLISWLDNIRCRHSRIIYGDQAFFIRQALFHKLGGFPHQPILEDVAFCEQLIEHTSPVLLDPPVVTDSRKFVQMGIWRSFTRVLLIILSVEFRLPIVVPSFFRDVR